MYVQVSEVEIINRIRAGEPALFELLIRRYNAFLYKTGRSYQYSHEDTQDLMQDTFVDAYRHLSKFENRSSFKTWLIRIMLNNCYRKQNKFSYKNEKGSEIHETVTPMFSNDRASDTNKLVLNKELGRVVENAIQHIPLDYRMVFTLREVNGLSVDETAEVLQISQSNVKVRLNRAKSLLRKEIELSYTPEDIFEFNRVYCDAIVNRVMSRIMHLPHEE